MLALDGIASERGDGLLPQLRDLLERRVQLATDPRLRELDAWRPGAQQSGPNPSGAVKSDDAGSFRPGNVVALPNPAVQLQSRPEKEMEG